MYPLLLPRRGFLAQWILENLRKIAPLYELHYQYENNVPVRFVDVEKTTEENMVHHENVDPETKMENVDPEKIQEKIALE